MQTLNLEQLHLYESLRNTNLEDSAARGIADALHKSLMYYNNYWQVQIREREEREISLRENQKEKSRENELILLKEIKQLDVKVEKIRGEVLSEIEKVRGEVEKIRGEVEKVRGEVEKIRGEVLSEIEKVRGEVEKIRGEVLSEIEKVRGEVRSEIEKVRGEVRSEIKHAELRIVELISKFKTDTIKWVFAILVGQVGLIAGIIFTLIKLFIN